MERPRAESSRAYRGVFRHIIDTGLITFLGEMPGQRSDITLPCDLPLDSCRANSRLVRAIIWHSALDRVDSFKAAPPFFWNLLTGDLGRALFLALTDGLQVFSRV